MFHLLPQALVTEVFEFDSTYVERFTHVISELQCPELTALLRAVPEIKTVTYCADDMTYFLADSGDTYLVVCSMVRMVVADSCMMECDDEWVDFFEVRSVTHPRLNHQIRALAEAFGWPALLRCEHGFEKTVEVRRRRYFVYKCLPDNALQDVIRNNYLYKVQVDRS